jgi:hypothetical protein
VKLRTIDDAGHMLPMTHQKEILLLITAHCVAKHRGNSKIESSLKARAAA